MLRCWCVARSVWRDQLTALCGATLPQCSTSVCLDGSEQRPPLTTSSSVSSTSVSSVPPPMRLAVRPTGLVPASRQLSCRLAASRYYRTAGALLSPCPPSPHSAARKSSDALPRTVASLLYPDGQPPSETAGGIVTIHGWIRSIRRMGKVCFAHISDGSSSMPLQAVLTKPQAAG